MIRVSQKSGESCLVHDWKNIDLTLNSRLDDTMKTKTWVTLALALPQRRFAWPRTRNSSKLCATSTPNGRKLREQRTSTRQFRITPMTPS